MAPPEVQLSDDEWRTRLSPDRYKVLRRAATEAPFTGELLHVDGDGVFRCAGCGAELFSSDSKFDSGSGWPSFDRAVSEGRVLEHEDRTLGMRRTEITCARCGGHLGHVFPDGPTETGLRYCVNSLSLEFDPGVEPFVDPLATDDGPADSPATPAEASTD
jgi:methionine-R-sulfoxide reductase